MFSLPKDEGLDDGLPVTVVFRRWCQYESDQHRARTLIALFPFIPAAVTQAQDECMSYESIGQHGSAEYLHVIENTDPIADTALDRQEVAALTKELEDRGYKLQPMTNEQVCFDAGYKVGLEDGSANV